MLIKEYSFLVSAIFSVCMSILQWCAKNMEEQSPQQVQGCCERFALDLSGQVIVDSPSNRITAKYHCVLHQDHQPHDHTPP